MLSELLNLGLEAIEHLNNLLVFGTQRIEARVGRYQLAYGFFVFRVSCQ